MAHGKLDLPLWSLFGYALAIVLLSIFAAIWAIARSSRNYRRYRGLCQELRELQQGTYDQEFVSEEPEIEELNDMERWILDKPEATVDQLAAHRSTWLASARRFHCYSCPECVRGLCPIPVGGRTVPSIPGVTSTRLG